ncbi:MAG TPA: hypothetical protein VNL16_11575 [Chloroflexota bacterium]|nr:hypothetical protein [Chloroflexota bacterium]
MANRSRYPRFQTWLLDHMVELDFTPMSLAMGLELLDGDVESWAAGRAVPTPEQCERLAQLFEIPVGQVLAAAGW